MGGGFYFVFIGEELYCEHCKNSAFLCLLDKNPKKYVIIHIEHYLEGLL